MSSNSIDQLNKRRSDTDKSWRRTGCSAAALLLVAMLPACAVEPGAEEPVTTRADALYYLSTALWDHREIPVCWETTGESEKKAWVKAALMGQRSWSSAANINFTGWDNCTTGAAGIHLTGGTANVTTGGLGEHADGTASVELDFVSKNYARCKNNNLTLEQCIKATAIHEFGHAIGYAHEQNRPNPPASCSGSTPQGSNGDSTFGGFDVESMTGYCNYSTQLSAMDRRGSDRVYGPPLRAARKLGDYTGDGRADLLCFDVLSGSLYRDAASTGGQFAGTDWSTGNGWCNGSDTRRLFTGDFNGDGRDDLLCFDIVSGSEWVDFADASGQFAGTDWSVAAGWCNGTESRGLHVGDFNGDGRDDLLCHDLVSGSEYIDYANASGQFGGTDWSASLDWCNATQARRLHVGDFNGDGRDDLLCHDLASGSEFVDYANASGQFVGTDFSVAAGWCNFDGAEVHVGDFNGDGRDDIVCHSAVNGRRWIDLANSSGQFGATDLSATNSWCRENGSRIFVGDVNGDGRSDLVCQNLASGLKAVDYAATTGALGGTDWSVTDGWCNVDSRDLH